MFYVEYKFEIQSKSKIEKFEKFLKKNAIEFERKSNSYYVVFFVKTGGTEADNIPYNYYLALRRN